MRIGMLFLAVITGLVTSNRVFAETRQGGNISGLGVLNIPVGELRSVNKGGNDTTCDGSLANPCLTLERMETLITDASTTKLYTILIGPGDYTLASGTIKKENIFWVCQGQHRQCRIFLTNLTSTSGLQINFTTAGNTGFKDIQMQGGANGLNITNTSGTNAVQVYLDNVSIRTPAGIVSNGGSTSGNTQVNAFRSEILGTVNPKSTFYYALATYHGGRITGEVNSALTNTPIVATGNTILNDNHITSVSTAGLSNGMFVSGTGITPGTTISLAGQPANTLLLSKVATVTATGTSFSFTRNFSSLVQVFHGTMAGLTLKSMSSGTCAGSHNQSTLVLNDAGTAVSADAACIRNNSNVTADAGTFLTRLTSLSALGSTGTIQGAVGVSGSADAVQLDVQGFSTQTNLVARFRDFAGTVLASLSNAGNWLVSGNASVQSGTPTGVTALAGRNITVASSGNDDGGLVVHTEGAGGTVDGTFNAYAGATDAALYAGSVSNHPLALYANNKSFLFIAPGGEHQLFGSAGSASLESSFGANLTLIRNGTDTNTAFLSCKDSSNAEVCRIDDAGAMTLASDLSLGGGLTASNVGAGSSGTIGTLTWVGTTDPSGTITQEFKTASAGSTEKFMYFRITATVAGLANTEVNFPLPAEGGTPNVFASQPNSATIAVGSGKIAGSADPSSSSGSCSLYKDGSGNYRVRIADVAVAATHAWCSLNYPTSP